MTIAEIKKIISRIHDKYKKDSKPPTGNQNCQLCTWCLEAQFRGIKVLPRPIYSPRDPALDIPGENIVINPTKKKFKNFDLLSNYILQEPKARYYVHVKWNNGYGGHEFMLWNTNVPHILDAQQGLCEPMTDLKTFHEYFGDINYNESFVCRLDDHEFNETLLNEMNAMSMLVPWDETVDTQYMKDHDMLGDDEDANYIRLLVPSDEATKYLKKDPECKEYWEQLNRETKGEVLIDSHTREQIGHAFVYHSGDNKGFIFNIQVQPKYRGQGFGKILLDDCVHKFGGKDLTVDVDNEIAVNMYLKYGFEVYKTGDFENNGKQQYWMKLKKSQITQEGFVQEDIPPVGAIFKAGLAANKAKNQLKAADLDISDYKQIPLTEDSMYEYKEGHGTFTYGLDNFLYHDDDEGLILLDEHDFVAGYILIRTLPDNKKWIISCEHSYEFPNDGITYQLLQLAPDMFDVEYARFPSSDKLICNQLIELGWKPIRQDGGLVFFQYDPSDEEEDNDDIDYDRMISEYVMESFHKNKLVYHLSTHRNLDGQVFKPRVPSYLNEYNPHEKEFENNTTPRVCFSPSIDGALNAICVNLYRLNPVQFSDVYVYIPEKPLNQYKQKSNKEIIRDHDVFDANLTKEMWILEPVRLKLYGVIHVDQARNVKRKHTAKNVDGERGDRRIFSYKWHWLVKPKVLDSQPYNYDTMAVCKMVADEISKFKYGLVKDGKLVRDTKESDWDKYWRLQSPEEFEKSGAGNCYDYTEWEAGFLDAYGIAYKKYFISGMNIDQKLATHTFIVASNQDKFIYIEGAFKRVVDEIGNLKEFDSLPSIFKYVAECMCEYENFGTMNYGVLDYTDNSPKPGTDIKHFIDWITHNCEMVYTGTVKTKHNKKE